MATKALLGISTIVILLTIILILWLLPLERNVRVHATKFIILAASQTLLSVFSFYVWRRITSVQIEFVCLSRLQMPWDSNGLFSKCGLGLFLGLAHFSMLSYESGYFTHPQTSTVTFLAFICLGLYIQLIIWLFTVDTIFVLLSWLKLSKVHRKVKVLLSVALALTSGFYGVYSASRPPEIHRVEVPISGLPSTLNNLKIVQVCDLHIGPSIGASRMMEVIESVNKLDADIIVITGDLVDASVEQMLPAVQPIKNMKSKLGTYFVTGNHEYISGHVDDWFLELQKIGVKVLHNSFAKIQKDPETSGNYLCLAGTDDIEARRFKYGDHGMDLDKAVSGCDKNIPIVLLAHQPRAAKLALDSKHNIQLVLSGHTHGGQMLPMTIIAYLVNPFYAGLYHYNQKYVYVSQGTMFWGIPMRHFSRGEITVITLQSQE